MSTAPQKFYFLLLVASLCSIGWSLKCHQCTSEQNTKCADPFVLDTPTGQEKKPKTMEFLKECPTNGTKPFTLCRKIYQNVRGEESIIRGCGYEEYKNECYKTVLEEYNTYVCQCKEDGCNTAAEGAGKVSAVAVLATAIASALSFGMSRL